MAVIVLDDRLATGASVRAAVQTFAPARIVVVFPSAPESTCRALSVEVSDILPPDDPPIS